MKEETIEDLRVLCETIDSAEPTLLVDATPALPVSDTPRPKRSEFHADWTYASAMEHYADQQERHLRAAEQQTASLQTGLREQLVGNQELNARVWDAEQLALLTRAEFERTTKALRDAEQEIRSICYGSHKGKAALETAFRVIKFHADATKSAEQDREAGLVKMCAERLTDERLVEMFGRTFGFLAMKSSIESMRTGITAALTGREK